MEIDSFDQALDVKSICRTCSQASEDLHSLNEYADHFPVKTLSDLLLDIAKIDTKADLNKMMPMNMCSTCSEKLQNSYSFVVQAQETNEKFLKCSNTLVSEIQEGTNVSKYLDCLLESPIDIPSNTVEYMHIKLEPYNTEESLFGSFPLSDDVNDNFDEDEPEMGAVVKDMYKNTVHMYDEVDQEPVSANSNCKPWSIHATQEGLVADTNIDLLSSTKDEEKHTMDPITVASTENKLSSASSNSDNSDGEWREKPKRRPGRPRLAKNKPNYKGRFSCEVCYKSFAWKKDLYRHLLCHGGTPAHSCELCDKKFLRKDKLKDHIKVHHRHLAENNENSGLERRKYHSGWSFAKHLYCYQSFTQIECKLCNSSFETIKMLKTHLSMHIDVSTLNLTETSKIIEELYSQTTETLDEIKSHICKEVAECHLGKFYAIVNENGYEMCLSDSDAGEDLTATKYTCEICMEKFARKSQAFVHLQEKHPFEKVPYKCTVCKVDFICKEIQEIHSRTQCRNKEKKYQCLKCPGKFMWLENLDNHKCSNRFNNPDYKSNLPNKRELLVCDVCDKTFASRKDLKRHRIVHERNVTHKCSICLQVFLKAENLRQHLRQEHKQLYRNIKCSLCGEEFDKLSQLRVHLPVHSDGFTAINIEKGIFFKTRDHDFSVDRKNSKVVDLIASDFLLENTTLFYSAVDASANELDLNDSETESDDPTENDSMQERLVYRCEICSREFFRRKHMLLHQYTEHNQLDELPHRCENCNKQFVCLALLQRHENCDCMNAHKKWKCNKCSTGFVWEDNLKAHTNAKHIDPEQQKSRKLANKLQCDECDKTFIWPKDLNRHKRCHLPDDEKFKCPFCTRRFNRKDNMHAHMKTHGTAAKQIATSKRDANKAGKHTKVKAPDDNYCKPNGCKQIQCMICYSKHTKIADLRTHMRTHQYVVSLNQHENKNITELSSLLYPGESFMTEKDLIDRIITDVAEKRWDRFYSITNEVGNELSISDSETESDSEDEEETIRKYYSCDLCGKTFRRKYKLFEHQKFSHDWIEAPYVCEICDARFLTKEFLHKHCSAQCKNTTKRFICKKCPIRFMWQDNLKIHERILHPEIGNSRKKLNTNSYECEVCRRVFSWQKDLTRHMLVHQPETKVFKCMWCPRKFYRKDNLYVHIKRHGVAPECLAAVESHISATSGPNGKKDIICKVCNLQFSSILALRTHIMQSTLNVSNDLPLNLEHNNYSSLLNYSITSQLGFELHLEDSESDNDGIIMPKAEGAPLKYSCELCNVETLRKFQISIHQRTAHQYEQLPRKCDKCAFKTVSKDILEHHMQTQCYNLEKKFECNVCSFKFMWEENLRRHIQCMHPSTSEQCSKLSENESSKSFQCEQCKCKYNRKDRLTAHMKKAHPGSDVQPTNSSKVESTSAKASSKTSSLERKFLCAFCGHAVTSSSNLIIHMRRHTGEKPFKCDFCEMAFPRSSDLQCHRRTHTGEKPHKCTVCDKAFSRSYKLQTHMRIHSGEKPYKCTYCEKSFTQSNDLTLHIRRHTGERPYVCGICGERFIQGTALKNHRTMRGHYEDTKPRKLTVLEQF